MFPTITAQNPALNATLTRAGQIVAELLAQKLSKNPRVYADEFIFGGCMIPWHAGQDNSDLPAAAIENWDGETTLDGMGVPQDLPVYLAILVAEGGTGNFVNVAQIDAEMRNQGKTLSQAVNLAPSSN